MSDAEDLIKKASGLFGKLGSTLKQTTKQVTGLGRGTVRIELDRTKLAPGETLHGRVVLALPEAVEAKRLLVTLQAHQRTVDFQRNNGGRTAVANRTVIFSFDLELGGPQNYDNRTVAFDLPIPSDALDKHAAAGTHPIADVVRSVASAFSPSAGPVEWSVVARLDIPWGRDLTHDVDILIAR